MRNVLHDIEPKEAFLLQGEKPVPRGAIECYCTTCGKNYDSMHATWMGEPCCDSPTPRAVRR